LTPPWVALGTCGWTSTCAYQPGCPARIAGLASALRRVVLAALETGKPAAKPAAWEELATAAAAAAAALEAAAAKRASADTSGAGPSAPQPSAQALAPPAAAATGDGGIAAPPMPPWHPDGYQGAVAVPLPPSSVPGIPPMLAERNEIALMAASLCASREEDDAGRCGCTALQRAAAVLRPLGLPCQRRYALCCGEAPAGPSARA
jgi:hypothetical protein